MMGAAGKTGWLHKTKTAAEKSFRRRESFKDCYFNPTR
jgi:hypothetical protein